MSDTFAYVATDVRQMSMEEFARSDPRFQAAFWKREAMRYQLDRWAVSREVLGTMDSGLNQIVEKCEAGLAEAQAEFDAAWKALDA